VLELVATEACVVAGMASPAAVDAVMATPGAHRVAPDELMVVGAAPDADALTASLQEALVHADTDAVALDTSDGWAVWSLRGDDAPRMFGYVASFPLPQTGLALGEVAHVPVRVLVAAPGEIHLLVPAMLSAYLRERLLERGRVLQIRAVAEPQGWSS